MESSLCSSDTWQIKHSQVNVRNDLVGYSGSFAHAIFIGKQRHVVLCAVSGISHLAVNASEAFVGYGIDYPAALAVHAVVL